ncbi:hypothetical protein TruAng_002962 [Truncatella angustata]|nr:hypothetical protein TruAng_002962 [Truncatella angustata]
MFRKWASLKAYAIINATEIVFWAAVVYLTIQAATQSCVAPTCALTWVIVALAINMCLLSAYATIVSYNNFRAARKIERTTVALESVDQSPYHHHTDAMMHINKTSV